LRRTAGVAVALVAAAALAVSLFLSACRLLTPGHRLLVVATSFVPLALVGYALAAAAWAVLRRSMAGRKRQVATVCAAASVAGVLVHAVLLAPAYVGDHATGRADLTVMTANLRLGEADPAAVTRIARDGKVDVAVLEEVTDSEYVALDRLQEELPYRAGWPATRSAGTLVLSRYPLEDVTLVHVSKRGWAMRVAAPRPFTLIGVHTSQPMSWPDLWGVDLDTIADVVRDTPGPLVVAGDFNATLDHAPMRRLLGLGLADAARQANSGWQPTWPGATDAAAALPFGISLIAIDHVLTSRAFSAVSTQTYRVPRSDHRALIARLSWR
jgi:endonuclease/exonuclease/phosphatase (EEP) superfamily protein YafD